MSADESLFWFAVLAGAVVFGAILSALWELKVGDWFGMNREREKRSEGDERE